jgi:hypothetical protein
MDVRPLLVQLEGAADPRPALAYVAAQQVDVDEDELRGAVRRALLLLAAGGDPRRELDPAGRAVGGIAADLGTPERRAALDVSLRRVRAEAEGLPRVLAALDAFAADGDAAWRWLACALLAEALADEDG